jgi:histidine triad (HIT) family protein
MDPSPDQDACIFCRIVNGRAAATIVFRDDQVTAFRDTHPIAHTHVLIVPNRHIDSVDELEAGDEQLLGHMVLVAKELARQEGVSAGGYRLIVNTGRDSGQTIPHLHLHLIAGKFTRFVIQ